MITSCSIVILTGCGIENDTQINQKSLTSGDRHSAHEFNQMRAYTFDQGSVKADDLSLRISNEAERVYNVKEAIVVVQGHDVIMSLSTKADPLESPEEIAKKVRTRLKSKEPQLAGYNLYITTEQEMREPILRVNTNMQNQDQAGYPVDHREPQFDQILQQLKKPSHS